MGSKLIIILLGLTAVILTSCVNQKEVETVNASQRKLNTDNTDYITSSKSCAVIAGGNGTIFADEKLNGFWKLVNTRITESLATKLKGDGFRVEKYFIKNSHNAAEEIALEMAKLKCNRIIQIYHKVDNSAENKTFSFKIDLLHLGQPAEVPQQRKTKASVFNDYTILRSFPLTQAELDKFTIDAFTESVFWELKADDKLGSIIN